MQDPQDGTPTSPGDSQAQSLDSPDDGQLPLSLDDTLENKALSLDVILEAARKRIEEQNALIGVLDTKAGFVLGSASLLTAGVGTFARTAFVVSERLSTANLKLDDSSRKGMLILAALALLFYLGIMICGLLAYRLRKYETLTEIGALRDLYLTETEVTTKLVMLDTLDKAIRVCLVRSICNHVQLDNPGVNGNDMLDKAGWTGSVGTIGYPYEGCTRAFSCLTICN